MLVLWDPTHSATLLLRQRLQCLHVPRLRPPSHTKGQEHKHGMKSKVFSNPERGGSGMEGSCPSVNPTMRWRTTSTQSS